MNSVKFQVKKALSRAHKMIDESCLWDRLFELRELTFEEVDGVFFPLIRELKR